MSDAVAKLRTDRSLIEALEKASTHKPSQDELLEQRVSFIYGSMKPESGLTRDRIKEVLLEQAGLTTK